MRANNMSTKKTKVDTAITVAVKSFHTETLDQVTRVEAMATDVESGRKEIMVTLNAHYGNAIAPAKQGGLSGNAMRTPDSIKAEASRLGITEGAARELHGIIKAINEVRANVWQDYQRAFFGRNEKAATIKDEPENIKALRATKAELIAERDAIKGEVKRLGEAIKAESDPEHALHLRGLQARSRLDVAKADIDAKAIDLQIKHAVEDIAGDNAYATLHLALEALGNKYKSHKDEIVAELAKQVLALL